MTNNIEKIYSTLMSTFEDNSEFMVDFYAKNSIFLNNISTFNNKEELRQYIEINWQYINAIFRKDRFNDTIDFIDKNLPIIDNEIIRLDVTDLKDEWYNGILFYKGMANYNLRDFKTSTPIFKYLVNVDCKNDNYKIWLNHSRHRQRIWLINIIWILSALCLLINVFAENYITNQSIRIMIPAVGFLGIVGNSIYEFYVKRSFKKSK